MARASSRKHTPACLRSTVSSRPKSLAVLIESAASIPRRRSVSSNTSPPNGPAGALNERQRELAGAVRTCSKLPIEISPRGSCGHRVSDGQRRLGPLSPERRIHRGMDLTVVAKQDPMVFGFIPAGAKQLIGRAYFRRFLSALENELGAR